MAAIPVDSQITFLSVADLDASQDFYCDVLGLDLVLDQGPCRIYRVTDSAYVATCMHRQDVSPQGVIITLVTDDVDGWHERLMAREVEIDAPPALNEKFQIYHIFCRDPDGYLVEIQRFLDPDWAS